MLTNVRFWALTILANMFFLGASILKALGHDAFFEQLFGWIYAFSAVIVVVISNKKEKENVVSE